VAGEKEGHAVRGRTSAPDERSLSRRKALSAAGLGLAVLGSTGRLDAAEWTPAERANVQIVNEFCAAWPSHDINRIMAFFADNGAYRLSERQEPAKGRPAVTDKINSFLGQVVRFEVLESFARGPMVFNERVDHFMGGALRSWHGVGVFFLRDGKIVEWYDYSISTERA
jgi:limonene-1,2-epoxide hydrolase